MKLFVPCIGKIDVSFLDDNKKTLSLITLAYSFGGMVFYGFLTWIPEHLRRAFDWDISNAGYVFGLMLAIFGSFGGLLLFLFYS